LRQREAIHRARHLDIAEDLKSELGSARTEVFMSKEFITTVLTGVGTAASWLAGVQLPLEGVITLGGAPVAIGGLLATRNKYLKDREPP
jgi:hypothetical protein